MIANNVLVLKPQKTNEAAVRRIVAETAATATAALDRNEVKLFGMIMRAYDNARKAHNYQPKSISRDNGIITDFVRFSGKAPWAFDDTEFEEWCVHLAEERNLSTASQRMYQGVIRRLREYITVNQKFRNMIATTFGITVRQVCTASNCIPHVLNRELARMRPAMTEEQLENFFTCLKETIAEAEQFNTKDRYALKRDLALFYLAYVSGLRANELLQLKLGSFAANPDIPDLGPYGLISVWRKGHKGSGKKFQQVVMTSPGLRKVLDWYIEEVRPWYVQRMQDPNDQSLFLSERGTALKYSAANERFKLALRRAGLDCTMFSLHSLRHTMVTHESKTLSIHALSQKVGHAHIETTLNYLHVPDKQINAELVHSVTARLDGMKKAANRKRTTDCYARIHGTKG